MSNANDLINQIENEHGRIDGANGMTALLGAMSRMMGKSPASYTQRDDFAAGVLIQHELSGDGARERAAKQASAQMLLSSLGVDIDLSK